LPTSCRTTRNRRKWFFDETFFQKRDDRVAYWMGFFMADGNLRGVGNTWTFSLALNSLDRHIMECLCHDLNLPCDILSTRPYRETQQLVTLQLTHESLQDWLLPWGIVPRKSHNFAEPSIPIECYPSFLRGWFDGDGCIRIDKEAHQYTAVLAGNLPGMEWYEKALLELGFRGRIRIRFQRNESGSAHFLVIGRQDDLLEFYDLLNVEGGLRLDRKWEKVHSLRAERMTKAQENDIMKKRVVAAFCTGTHTTLLELAREFRIGKARARQILMEAGAALKTRSPRGPVPPADGAEPS
jgi:hypothetical protein